MKGRESEGAVSGVSDCSSRETQLEIEIIA